MVVSFVWENVPTLNWILSLVLIVAIYGLLFFMFAKIIKRTTGYIMLSISAGAALLSFIFYLQYIFAFIEALTAVGITISLFSNLGDLRQFLANPFKTSHIKSSKVVVEKIYNREELYKIIETTVINLSKTRTGAIMTFEKNTSLADVIKNGVIVNAPVTSELLTTIFYPGTRLHDGAVVIRRDIILAASVYYTPTTKPLTGKFGSRHRASIGISEVTDSVTVVVSEETGRISIAVAGELIHVPSDTFLRTLEDYILADSTKAE